MTTNEITEKLSIVYFSLNILAKADPAIATPAIASLRLILIHLVGKEEQRQLVDAWNNELAFR